MLTVQVRVDGVEPDQKVTESVLLGGRDLGQQGRDDLFSRRELPGRKESERSSARADST
jgi:hypothetical protein